MENQIKNSDFVLVVCTKTYLEKYKQIQDGKGVSWEIRIICQELYKLKGHNNKFIPIIFDNDDISYIVPVLESFTHYNVKDDLQKLINRINGVPNVVKPPITFASLPEKERKSLFLSSPINMELWDKAKWSGVVFVVVPPNQWLMALNFAGDYKSAIQIFEERQKIPEIDDYVTFTFIECNIEKLPKNGYTCLISLLLL